MKKLEISEIQLSNMIKIIKGSIVICMTVNDVNRFLSELNCLQEISEGKSNKKEDK